MRLVSENMQLTDELRKLKEEIDLRSSYANLSRSFD